VASRHAGRGTALTRDALYALLAGQIAELWQRHGAAHFAEAPTAGDDDDDDMGDDEGESASTPAASPAVAVAARSSERPPPPSQVAEGADAAFFGGGDSFVLRLMSRVRLRVVVSRDATPIAYDVQLMGPV